MAEVQESTTKENLYDLIDMVHRADENGLFKGKNDKFTEITNTIITALEEIAKKQEKQAYEKLCIAYNKFNGAINSAPRWWRFSYCFGGPIVLYFVAIALSIFLAWLLFPEEILNSKILGVPSWAFMWGSMGGILQGLWRLWQYVSSRNLRKHWFLWFLLLPFLGAILGALIYLIYFAGFIVSTGATQLTSEFFAMLLSALGGFSAWWAIDMLNTLTEIIQITATKAEASQEE